jgi:hypothetical protein
LRMGRRRPRRRGRLSRSGRGSRCPVAQSSSILRGKRPIPLLPAAAPSRRPLTSSPS